jgi:hypothetical protein
MKRSCITATLRARTACKASKRLRLANQGSSGRIARSARLSAIFARHAAARWRAPTIRSCAQAAARTKPEPPCNDRAALKSRVPWPEHETAGKARDRTRVDRHQADSARKRLDAAIPRNEASPSRARALTIPSEPGTGPAPKAKPERAPLAPRRTQAKSQPTRTASAAPPELEPLGCRDRHGPATQDRPPATREGRRDRRQPSNASSATISTHARASAASKSSARVVRVIQPSGVRGVGHVPAGPGVAPATRLGPPEHHAPGWRAGALEL